MSSDDYSDHEKHEDLKVLHGMGYAQELQRSMSKFSNFAISFSIICILSGGINSFAQAIGLGGWRGRGHRLDRGCCLVGHVRPVNGADLLGLPHGGRALPLGIHPREPLLGLDHRLAQPSRPDHRAWCHQHRHRLFLHRHLRVYVRFHRDRLADRGLRCRDHRHPGDLQPHRHQGHHLPDRHLGLHHLRDDRRSGDRLPLVRPRHRHLAALDLHQLLGRGGRRSSRNRTTSATSSCCASSCRSIRSPATTPRPIPPRRPRTPRIRCRAASSRRCSGRPSSAGS
jgi:hypothetical protein